MDKGSVVTLVDRFREGLAARGVRTRTIILFGSQATGSAVYGSDIDLVVVSDDFAGKTRWERVVILSDVIYDLFAPIEAIAMTPEEWDRGDSFIADFARDGEVLFAA